MYENVTYELLLKRMLDRVKSNMDKREGSVIYDSTAPSAVELQNVYIALDTILNETFADTASLYYLKKRAAERGIYQIMASNAILRGEFTPNTVEIPIGSRFSCGKLNYVITEKVKTSANLIRNGSFETLDADGKPVNVSADGGDNTFNGENETHIIVTGKDNTTDGNNAVKITDRTTGSTLRLRVSTTSVKQGKTYQFSFNLKGNTEYPVGSGTFHPVTALIVYKSSSGSIYEEIPAEFGVIPNENDWTTFNYVFELTKDVTEIDFLIGVGWRPWTGIIDEVCLYEYGEIKSENTVYKLMCETAGTEGNVNFGTLIPIDYISGLETAELTELLIPARADETVEELRERYFANLTSQAYGGNIADYKEKTMMIDGVGGVKVTPVWDGGGTVKLTIIDNTFSSPSEELIEKVKTEVDPYPNEGMGYGFAPIGHIVTVEGAKNVIVNIQTEITYAEGWSWEAANSIITKAVDNYFKELSKTWEDDQDLIVRISQIESRILDCAGVIDISGTTLNGSASNLYLASNEIPVRGTINGK